MDTVEAGQSLVETIVLNALIVAGMIAIWSICQGRVEDHIRFLLDLAAGPMP